MVYLLDSHHDSANDDLRPSEQWRGWPVDRAKFIKDAAPREHASPRDTETFTDKIKVVSKFPEPKSAFLEIPTDFTIAHNADEVKQSSILYKATTKKNSWNLITKWKRCNVLRGGQNIRVKGKELLHSRGGRTPYIFLQTITGRTHVLACCLTKKKVLKIKINRKLKI